jgi:hypothetical protein
MLPQALPSAVGMCQETLSINLGIDPAIYPAIVSPIEPEIDLDPPAGRAAQQR